MRLNALRYLVAGKCFSKWAGRLFVGMGLLTTLLLNGPSFAQTSPVVYVVPIEGIIDLGLAPFVQRVLGEATDAGAAAVILDINTFGGRVDAAVLIRDALLNARVKTVAFVNKRAISAGALYTKNTHDHARIKEHLVRSLKRTVGVSSFMAESPILRLSVESSPAPHFILLPLLNRCPAAKPFFNLNDDMDDAGSA